MIGPTRSHGEGIEDQVRHREYQTLHQGSARTSRSTQCASRVFPYQKVIPNWRLVALLPYALSTMRSPAGLFYPLFFLQIRRRPNPDWLVLRSLTKMLCRSRQSHQPDRRAPLPKAPVSTQSFAECGRLLLALAAERLGQGGDNRRRRAARFQKLIPTSSSLLPAPFPALCRLYQ